jgi:hypothetical protein
MKWGSVADSLRLSMLLYCFCLSRAEGQSVVAETSVVTDARGCKSAILPPDPALQIRSTVPCVDGWLEGFGRIEAQLHGVTTYVVDASPSSGLKVKHGTIELSLRAEDLSFQITACRLNGNSIEYRDFANSCGVSAGLGSRRVCRARLSSAHHTG